MCTYFLRFISTVAEKDTAGYVRPRMGHVLAAATSIESLCGISGIILHLKLPPVECRLNIDV